RRFSEKRLHIAAFQKETPQNGGDFLQKRH
ncbi:hypothetical protein CCACVL1_05957, partial [Corchorus capsularis]